MAEKNPEQDYFARLELEKMQKLRARLEKEQNASELEARQQAHWHRCGKCGGAMETRTFRGVEIEVCPDCGAVLLDHGELEELAGKDRSGIFKDIAGLFGGRP